MTLELSANKFVEPVSYEGEYLPIHMVQSFYEMGDRFSKIIYIPRSHDYDCNLRHAFRTLQAIGMQVKTLRVVAQ